MALTNRRDPNLTAARLSEWFGQVLPPGAEPRISDVALPSSSGMSNDTVLFDLARRDGGTERAEKLVARIEPSGGGVYSSYDIAREHRVMTALAGSAVPVPPVRWFERDPAVLGAPFLVMEQVSGRVPGDDPPFTTGGWVVDLSRAEQRALHDNAVATLAAIHTVPWRDRGLAALEPTGDRPSEQEQLARLREFHAWAAEGRDYPLVEAALGWLEANRPADDGHPTVLSWGDARVGNMMFGPDLSVLAVLDWEMTGLARPELDLGWWRFMQLMHSEGIGAPLPGGFPAFAETVGRYQELSGHEVFDLDYHTVVAGVKVAIILIRATRLMTSAGLIPADSAMDRSNPGTGLLAELIGQSAPSEAATSWVGRR